VGCRERWTAAAAAAASGEKSVYLLSCVENQVCLCAFCLAAWDVGSPWSEDFDEPIFWFFASKRSLKL
jgi:hypothetical protein